MVFRRRGYALYLTAVRTSALKPYPCHPFCPHHHFMREGLLSHFTDELSHTTQVGVGTAARPFSPLSTHLLPHRLWLPVRPLSRCPKMELGSEFPRPLSAQALGIPPPLLSEWHWALSCVSAFSSLKKDNP